MLEAQQLVIFPATCMYGIAANALDETCVQKVFEAKQRPSDMPILVLVKSARDIQPLVESIPENAQKLMDRFWPGRITLVFNAAPGVSPILTAGTGKIGVRMPAHPIAKALAASVSFPITGTSANLSGQPSAFSIAHLHPGIAEKAACILDAGTLKGGMGSSIVDVTTDPVTIIREGQVSAGQIRSTLED